MVDISATVWTSVIQRLTMLAEEQEESAERLSHISDRTDIIEQGRECAAAYREIAALVKARSPVPWSVEWPTKEGEYWFFNRRIIYPSDTPSFMRITVERSDNFYRPDRLCYRCSYTETVFIYPNEYLGYWQPVRTPHPPKWEL